MSLIEKNIDDDYSAEGDGTSDDAPEFMAFRLDMATNHPGDFAELSLGVSKTYLFDTNVGAGVGFNTNNCFTYGIPDITVIGNGARLTNRDGFGFTFGARGQIGNASNSAMVETVAAGSRVLQLVEAHLSKASLFVVGNYIWVTGVDIQGLWNSPYGFPSNQQFLEPVKILDVDASTGRIIIDRPLRYSYKSTWARYNSGSAGEVDNGGPATIYAFDANWNARNYLKDFECDAIPNQVNAKVREITLQNIDCPLSDSSSVFPSENEIFRAIGCDFGDYHVEVDKMVDVILYDRCTIRRIGHQSGSINTTIFLATDVIGTGATCTGTGKKFIGRGRKANGDRSQLTTFWPGAYAYGYSEEVDIEGYDIADFDSGGHSTAKSSTWTITDGVIRIPNTEITGSGPLSRVLVPGARVFWFAQVTPAIAETSRGFRVIDIYQDATYLYVETDWIGDFPANVSALRSHPCPRFRMRDCIGTDTVVDLCGAPAFAPLWSYSNRTHTPSTAGSLGGRRLWGNIVSIKINVTQAADPGNANARLRLSQFNNYPFILSDGSVNNTWAPQINMKITGERVITPSGVTGTQSGDSDLTMPASLMWSVSSIGPYNVDNLTGTPPEVSIEIITDQGFDEEDTRPAFRSAMATF